MITHTQSERYTALHDKLGAVYHKKENIRTGLLALHSNIKSFFNDITNENQQKKELLTNKALPDVHNDDFLILYLKKLQAFFLDVNRFMEANIPINDSLEAIMKDVIAQHKILSSKDITISKADDILKSLDDTIGVIKQKIDTSDIEFEALKKQYALLQTAYHYDKN